MHVDGQHIWLSFFMNRVEPSHVLLQELLTRHCKFIWRDDVVMYLYIISKMLELKLKSTIKEYENEKIFQIIWRAERGAIKSHKVLHICLIQIFPRFFRQAVFGCFMFLNFPQMYNRAFWPMICREFFSNGEINVFSWFDIILQHNI